MNSTEIILSPWEIILAAQAGVMRQAENIKLGRAPYYGAGSENDWQLHVEGCLGEMALARFLGIFWTGKGALNDPDVGSVDVRTRSRQNYDLIIHPNDPDDRIFWLVCGKNGKYIIKGWIRGADGKRDEFWQDPAGGRPAFFVPQHALTQPTTTRSQEYLF